jgi:hypothetical protein
MKRFKAVLLGTSLFLLSCTPSNAPSGTDQCKVYNRDDFAYGQDFDHDGCYTRAEILQSRSLIPVELDPQSKCRVSKGKWVDPYSGDTVYNADSVEIDHLVALAEAYASGAVNWPNEKKVRFANTDSLNELVITKNATNQFKGSKDIADWLPSDPARALWYAKQWISIKLAWELGSDERELGALRVILGDSVYLPILKPEASCP